MGCKMNQAVDVTFSNPPYNSNMDLKIITSLQEAKLLKTFVCVHPSLWLINTKTQLNEKSGKATFRKFKSLVKNHVKQIEFFNGNSVFNIGLYVPCIISNIDFINKVQSVKVKDLRKQNLREVNNLDNITLHGENWELVKSLMNKTKNYESLEQHRTSCKDAQSSSHDFHVQLATIRGHISSSSIFHVDFFTLIQKETKKSKGLRKLLSENKNLIHQKDKELAQGEIVFSFVSEKEQDNFLKYLQTDFARLCLSILKTNCSIARGELTLVPWLDFTQSWDDDKLFSFFGYLKGHPIREYAKTFLPDYYNLYPNGKTY